MDRLLPFDELNILRTQVENIYETNKDRRKFREYIEDSVLDILIMAYVFGNEAANTMLGTGIEVNQEELRKSVEKKIAGEDWKQRIAKYTEQESATAEDVVRVAETDAHRIYNEAIWDVAQEAKEDPQMRGRIFKTWVTMADEKVRSTHEYLEGMTLPLEERFFSYDGDSADRPGDFFTAENNCGCRCRLALSIQ